MQHVKKKISASSAEIQAGRGKINRKAGVVVHGAGGTVKAAAIAQKRANV